MRCPYCHENIRVQGRFCSKCGAQIFGLPARGQAGSDHAASDAPAPPPPRRASSEIIDIDLEEVARPSADEAEAIGKTCPYCRFPIKPGQAVTICSECGVPHHSECWEENGGCTTYGCRGASQGERAGATYATARGTLGASGSESLPVGAQAIFAAELDGQATNALIFAVLSVFCCGILSIISLFWGASIISQINKLGLGTCPARSKAIAAVVVSGIVLFLALIWGLVVIGGGAD